MLRRIAIAAVIFLPLTAAAEPPRPDACPTGYVPPAESVGRLLDSLSALLSAVSRSLPQPPKSEIDVARERVAALAPETGRNAHLLSREVSAALSHFEPVEIFSRRSRIASRLRVEVPLDDTALLVMLETGLIPPSQGASPPDLGDKVTRGALTWSDPALPPRATAGAVIRLRPDRTSDRTIIAQGRDRYDWKGAPFLVQHRAIAPPSSAKPEALVLGPLHASDVEAIALPAGEAWDERAARIAARHPNLKLTRTAP